MNLNNAPAICSRCRRDAGVKLLRFLDKLRQEAHTTARLAEADALEAAIAGVLRLRLPCACGRDHPLGGVLPEEAAP